MFLKIYFFLSLIVIGLFVLNEFIPDKPKNKFGKWWRKHIFEIEND